MNFPRSIASGSTVACCQVHDHIVGNDCEISVNSSRGAACEWALYARYRKYDTGGNGIQKLILVLSELVLVKDTI
jgi:hypothetical protein